jgi:hypothetical protein
MKRNLAVALFSIAALTGAGSALAQDQAVRSTVPFAFSVGDKQLPADTYTITSSEPGTLTIRSSDGRFAAITTKTNGDNPSANNKLIFTKYGNQYFLHEVRCAQVDIDALIPTSKQEKRARERAQEARLQGEEVMVAAM